MNKLLKGETIDLRLNLKVYSVFFFILLASQNFLAQIPLNSFCRYQEFPAKPGTNIIVPVDYNLDGWRGIVSFAENERNYTVQNWDKNKFTNPSERFLPFNLTRLKTYGSEAAQGKRFVYSSRKNREVGILSFSKWGAANIQSKIKLNSYPANIDVGDVNKNGRLEILVSGGAYFGMSIISEYNSKLSETVINNDRLFSNSVFIDLDYDSYPDVAAVDLFTNSILFFYNDKAGKFKFSRSINSDREIRDFKTNDINSDGFDDLIYIKGNNIEILQGDSVSSFKKKIIVNCIAVPDKYTVLDFNADGYNDIAFVNIETGSLFIVFAKNSDSFYEPVLYLQRKGIVDISSYVDRGGRKLAALDQNGKIYLFDKVLDRDEDFSISLGASPGLIGGCELKDENRKGLYFIDNKFYSLNFLLGSKKNLFQSYYSIPLSNVYSNVAVDDIPKDNKTFFCFTPGYRVIELFRIEFGEQIKYRRRVLYAEGPIQEIKLTSDRQKDRQTVFVLVNKHGKLQLQTFEFRDFRYISSGLDSVAVKSERAALSFGSNNEIYYFTTSDNSLYLNKTTYGKKQESPVNVTAVSTGKNEKFNYEVESFSSENNPRKPVVAWVSNNVTTNLFLFRSGYQTTLTLNGFSPTIGFMKYLHDANTGNLYLYDKYKGIIKKISFFNNFLDNQIKDVFESQNINNYIVSQINGGIELLIFTDSSNNLINFRYIR